MIPHFLMDGSDMVERRFFDDALPAGNDGRGSGALRDSSADSRQRAGGKASSRHADETF